MLLNIGAARRLASGRKQLPTFKQGKVNARKYLAQQNRMISVSSRRLQKKLNTSFRKDLSIIINELGSSAGPNYAESVRRKTVEIQAAVKSEIKKIFTTLVESNDSRYKPVLSKAVTDIGFGFNRPAAIENWVDSYFEEREVQFANISERMTNRILTSVEIDQLEGVGVDQIRRNLRGRFTDVGRNQAALIARTETHNAAGYAQNAYHQGLSKDLGISMQKQWVATLDARTRRAHGAMNGVQVGIDEDFSMPNGSLMAYTGDSRGGAANVVNCRCAIVYIDVDDDVIDEKIPDDEFELEGTLVPSNNVDSIFDYKQVLNEKVTATQRRVQRVLAKPSMISANNDEGSYYSGRRTIIASVKDRDGQTVVHEYGHHIDYSLPKKEITISSFGKAWSETSTDFQKAFKDDRKSLKLMPKDYEKSLGGWHTRLYDRSEIPDGFGGARIKTQIKTPEAATLSDIIDAMSKGAFQSNFYAWGHGKSYYKRSGSTYKETFANLYALRNTYLWKTVEADMPNLAREFDKILEEVADASP